MGICVVGGWIGGQDGGWKGGVRRDADACALFTQPLPMFWVNAAGALLTTRSDKSHLLHPSMYYVTACYPLKSFSALRPTHASTSADRVRIVCCGYVVCTLPNHTHTHRRYDNDDVQCFWRILYRYKTLQKRTLPRKLWSWKQNHEWIGKKLLIIDRYSTIFP